MAAENQPQLDRSVLVVTGETSGERHAAGVISEVNRRLDRPVAWFGSGGPRMRSAGVDLLTDVAELSAIGPWAALSNAGAYWRLYRRVLEECRRRRPRLALLVDFPEFNLKLARRLKSRRIPVCYFIGPQVWAWRPGRVEKIRASVDRLLVILPFEESYYRERGVAAHYVGNPSRMALDGAIRGNGRGPHESPVVALMPGSRRREVDLILPIQLQAADWIARRRPARFRLIQAPEIERGHLESHCGPYRRRLDLEIRRGEAGRHLADATCAVIKSGTSTLEATILGVPFAMVYRMSWPSYLFGRSLVATDTYCLANLIAGRRIVPEFVQREATPEGIGGFILELLEDPGRRQALRRELEQARERLGDDDAYRVSATHIAGMLSLGWKT